MNDADLDAIRAQIAAGHYRVGVVETSVGKVVVKRQRPARGAWRARAVNVLARGLGVALLQAVPAHGGARGQAIEVERLRSLGTAGVQVPGVMHVDHDFIVVAHLAGPSLVESIERRDTAAFEAWRRGLAALVDTHARGGYLSHAFARNFIVAEGGLAMIDFEDDPLEVMSLDQAQARDWLAYLHSTLWLLDRPGAEVQAALAVRLGDERLPVRALVEAAGQRLAVLRHLPRSRRVWGREVAGAQALGAVFPLPPDAAATMSGVV
ncbi:MAG: hypothetical protein ABJA61_10585 [Caldimonas sp.]